MAPKSSSLVSQLRKYRAGTPERESEKDLRRRRRGMPDAEFRRMYDAQHGLCLIGGHRMGPIGSTRGGNVPVLDHSHKTGKNRGIICRNHNSGLGMFHDSSEELQAALDYLDIHAE